MPPRCFAAIALFLTTSGAINQGATHAQTANHDSMHTHPDIMGTIDHINEVLQQELSVLSRQRVGRMEPAHDHREGLSSDADAAMGDLESMSPRGDIRRHMRLKKVSDGIVPAPPPSGMSAASDTVNCHDRIKASFSGDTGAGVKQPLTNAVAFILTGVNVGIALTSPQGVALQQANPGLPKTFETPGRTFEGGDALDSWREDLEKSDETSTYVVDWPYLKVSFVVLKQCSTEHQHGDAKYRLYLTSCPLTFQKFLSGQSLPQLAGGETLLQQVAGGTEVGFHEFDDVFLSRLKIITSDLRHQAGTETIAVRRTDAIQEAAYGLFGCRPDSGDCGAKSGAPSRAEASLFPSIKAYGSKDRVIAACGSRASGVAMAFKSVH